MLYLLRHNVSEQQPILTVNYGASCKHESRVVSTAPQQEGSGLDSPFCLFGVSRVWIHSKFLMCQSFLKEGYYAKSFSAFQHFTMWPPHQKQTWTCVSSHLHNWINFESPSYKKDVSTQNSLLFYMKTVCLFWVVHLLIRPHSDSAPFFNFSYKLWLFPGDCPQCSSQRAASFRFTTQLRHDFTSSFF